MEINIVEQKPEPETATAAVDLDDLRRAMDMTLMSFEQKVGERAEGGEVTVDDIVDVLQGMFRDAVGELTKLETMEGGGQWRQVKTGPEPRHPPNVRPPSLRRPIKTLGPRARDPLIKR